MKNFKTVFAAGSALVALGLGATGAHAATATADATAEILQQVQIAKSGDLNFGTIVPDSAASGVVSIAANAAGTRSCAANLTCAGAASVSSASFNVTGANGLNVDVTGLGGLTQLSDGTNNMAITLNGSSSVLAMTGSAVPLYVGGNLTVAANQPAGVYSGTFSVSVDYQ